MSAISKTGIVEMGIIISDINGIQSHVSFMFQDIGKPQKDISKHQPEING
jgi:hypothetical protein